MHQQERIRAGPASARHLSQDESNFEITTVASSRKFSESEANPESAAAQEEEDQDMDDEISLAQQKMLTA